LKRILIGCEILKAELAEIIENNNIDIEARWLDEDLHNHPEKLKVELQKAIDSLKGYDEILLSYGLCGNALVGITATSADLLYLKIDDCICGFLCDNKNLNEMRKNSVFISRGWLTTKNPFQREYERTVKKYGQERAEEIYQMMYEHYKNVVYMQTEHQIDQTMKNAAADMAEKLQLSLCIESANVRLYEKLLKGEADPRIKRLKKGETIRYENFLN
jgi:hypothetical protein